MGFFRDERNGLSMARVHLTASLGLTFALIGLDTVTRYDVPEAAYALLGIIFTGLLAWTAGPRIAQYLGPQLGGIASGLGQALRNAGGGKAGNGGGPKTPEDVEP